MAVNGRPSKRMRKRVSADLPNFFTFPATSDGTCDGPFRSSVRIFLERHARPIFPPSVMFSCLATWQVLLHLGNEVDGGSSTVDLEVVEEDVTRSRSIYCDQCRVVGWSEHPVCRKRYHFIIRRQHQAVDEEEEESGYQKPCTRCGNQLHLLDSRCKSCNSIITADSIVDGVYLEFQDTTHLLHGVVHSNGFGHLLTLNGREGGSTILSGCDIMGFWDRLCRALFVRKTSVMDISKKCGMEYRLLHAVTHGRSWYGNWGYEFGTGSYAHTVDAYLKAVKILSNMPLATFYFQGRGPKSPLQTTIAYYQSISETELRSLRDLLSFILKLIRETHEPSRSGACKKPRLARTTNVLCSWTRDDVDRVEEAMIKLLLVTGGDKIWVSRHALKGALCRSATSELLDYCLKYLRGRVAANGMVVNTRYNPNATIEYRLEPYKSVKNGAGSNLNHPSEEYLIRDLKFLYNSILNPQTMVSFRPQMKRELIIDSVAKLLDCKQFIKDYKSDIVATEDPSALCVWCHIVFPEQPKDNSVPPELLILPQNASIADLKHEATEAFQEIYPMFKRFEANKLLDYGAIDDSMTLKLLVGLMGSVRVQGRCSRVHGLGRFRMERGIDNWIVDCKCGAKDDDGERMLACDTCGIWQHTRCVGIDENDAIPAKFVCMRCLNSYQKTSNMVIDPHEEPQKTSGRSRNEATRTTSLNIQTGLASRSCINSTADPNIRSGLAGKSCRNAAAKAANPNVQSGLALALGIQSM